MQITFGTVLFSALTVIAVWWLGRLIWRGITGRGSKGYDGGDGDGWRNR